ncbi:F-box and leucine-rich protein 22 [Plecturocebus cupreus]
MQGQKEQGKWAGQKADLEPCVSSQPSAFTSKGPSPRCPNLASVTLSGCGHVTDDCLARLLRCCPRLRALRLENCARVTNRTLAAVAADGRALQTLHVDFCRNVSAAGLRRLRAACPRLALRAEHSAAMLPDQLPRPRAPAAALSKLVPR